MRGVVAGEVPASWPAAALRAQAVAARTYAIATSKDGDGFDQYADTRSQMYIGIAGEQASTNAAVARDRAARSSSYDGKAIVTYYFSTSGGRTEDVENSFLGAEPQPWLKSVADPYDGASPRHRWTKRMTLAHRRPAARRARQGQPAPDQGAAPRALAARRAGAGRRHGRAHERHGAAAARAPGPVRHVGALHGDHRARRARRRQHAAHAGRGAAGTGGATPRVARTIRAAALEAARRDGRGHARRDGRRRPAPGRGSCSSASAAGSWKAQFETVTSAGGRYRTNVPRRGLYRVRHRGEAGPAGPRAVAVGARGRRASATRRRRRASARPRPRT